MLLVAHESEGLWYIGRSRNEAAESLPYGGLWTGDDWAATYLLAMPFESRAAAETYLQENEPLLEALQCLSSKFPLRSAPTQA